MNPPVGAVLGLGMTVRCLAIRRVLMFIGALHVAILLLGARAPALSQSGETLEAMKHIAKELGHINKEFDKNNLDKAESRAKLLLEYSNNRLGDYDPFTGDIHSILGTLADVRGRPDEAQVHFERMLKIREDAFGHDDPKVADSLDKLGRLQWSRGNHGTADRLLARALAIKKKAFGEAHLATAETLREIGRVQASRGRYAQAESTYRRVLAIREAALRSDDWAVGDALVGLASVYSNQGRDVQAEPLLKRAIDVFGKVFGRDHPWNATVLGKLGNIYVSQRRYDEAEVVLERAADVSGKVFGTQSSTFAIDLTNLAALYRSRGMYEEAADRYSRAHAIAENVYGGDHALVAKILNGLALVRRAQGRYEDAEALYKRSLAVREKVFGAGHATVSEGLNNLAYLYAIQGRYAEAEPLYERSLAIGERVYDPVHAQIALSLSNLALLHKKLGKPGEALREIRRSTEIRRSRWTRDSGVVSSGAEDERRAARYAFLNHLFVLADALRSGEIAEPDATSEGFEVAQLAVSSAAARAVARMGARFAAGDDALAERVRARQDAVDEWRAVNGALTKAIAERSSTRHEEVEATLKSRFEDLERTIADADARITERFPEYAELANPRPVAVDEVRALLGADEALVAYVFGKSEGYVWVLRRDRAAFRVLEIGADDLAKAVTELRRALDPSGIRFLDELPPFPTTAAYAIYDKVFAAAENIVGDARHVFVVPDGALGSLPLGVLVTEAPTRSIDDFSGYRSVPWLARRYALTTLPSVGSLRALRRFAPAARARKPFFGIGDPDFRGAPGGARLADAGPLFARSGLGDVHNAPALPRLPETAQELRAIAASVGASDDAIYLGARAREATVKTADLRDTRIIAFATHGLVAGDFEDLGEPALALTPPATATEEDDGLLTASEVAHLDLAADWVVLSACNTAAPDGTPGADGLSGLARAFFYAGAKAMLVSHWPVESQAATRLTTGAFAISSEEMPWVGRSIVFQQAQLDLMNDPDTPYFAHPALWAPFVVVGEGGTFRPR